MIYHKQYWEHSQEDRFIRCSSPVLIIKVKEFEDGTVFIGGRCSNNSIGSYLKNTWYNHFTLKFFCKEHELND